MPRLKTDPAISTSSTYSFSANASLSIVSIPSGIITFLTVVFPSKNLDPTELTTPPLKDRGIVIVSSLPA